MSSAPEFLSDVVSRLRTLCRLPGIPDATVVPEIEELNAILRALQVAGSEANSEKLHWCLDASDSLSAPIRRLPDEMLSEIFVHIPLMTLHDLFEWCITQPHLKRLSAVCWRWNNVVHATPALWTRVKVDRPPGPTNIAEESIEREYMSALSRTLELSRQRPLHVDIDISSPADYKLVERRPLRLLVQSCSRWRHIDLRVDASKATIDLLSAVSGRLSAVETASVILLQDFSLPMAVDLFGRSPDLLHLELYVQSFVRIVPFPWGKLQSLRMRPGRSAIRPLLQLLEDLPDAADANLDITLTLYFHDPVLEQQRTSLVRSLHFGVGDRETLASFLKGWTLPRLRMLSITATEGCIDLHAPTFLECCVRSSLDQTLTSLDIASVEISSTNLLRCLQELRQLENLVLADHPVHRGDVSKTKKILLDDSLLAGLAACDEQGFTPILVPRLRSFYFFSIYLEFTPRLLLDLGQVRAQWAMRSESCIFELGIGAPGTHLDADIWEERETRLGLIRSAFHMLVETAGTLRWIPERFWEVPEIWQLERM
uniref:F-box domain-containing protein n=1 Tax=Mycena chlorophos TaxID=658473 RepID=A0ABQ0LLK0_MYCCL|nr:predicted protein [Mycena chlorophos]